MSLYADCRGSTPDGKLKLAIADEYQGYHIFEILNSTTVTTGIPTIDIYLLLFEIDLMSLTMDCVSVGMISCT